VQKINFLILSNDLSRGEQGNTFVMEFMKKACNLIEAEINEIND